MKLPEICIKHPVFACVLSICIVLLGIISFQKLEIQYFPDHYIPSANVDAYLTGASADFMSNNVADKMIDAATGLDHVKTMTTNCSQGHCNLAIQFEENTSDIQYANLMNQLRSKIAGVSNFPPSMTDKPTVTDDSATHGSMTNMVSFSNNGDMTPQQMYDYLHKQIVPQLRHVQGIGAIWGPYGGGGEAVRVWLKPERMMALNIKASDVVGTLSAYNATFTAGTIVGKERDFTINPINQVTNVDDVANLVIRVDNNNILRVKDVADVKMGQDSLSPSTLTINGKRSMSLMILPLRSENPVNVAKRLKKKIAQIQPQLPAGLSMKMVYDQTDFIQRSIDDGFSTLVEAIILVSLVVMLFLGSVRVACVPIMTIPVCIIGVFGVMSALGFSINMLTILAIVLAIGLVVDDAIVVVENCYRHIEEGLTPLQAALKGSQEIVFPVIAMTLTLAVVYLPIGLMSGLTADLFRQFAFTLAAAVIISGFVALTLSPMMSAYLIKPSTSHPIWFQRVDNIIQAITQRYTQELTHWFERKRIMSVIALTLVLLSGWAFFSMPQVLLPTEDTGFINAFTQPPAGVGRKYHLDHIDELNAVMKNNDSIANNMSYIQSTPSNHLLLKPWDERSKTASEIVQELTDKANKTLSAYDLSFKVHSADNLNIADNLILEISSVDRDKEALASSAKKVQRLLNDYAGITNVKNSTTRDQLRYDLSIDRNAITLSGVSYNDVTNALSTFLGSAKAADLHADDGYTYPIKVQVNRHDLSNFKVLDKLYVNSQSGQGLPLSQFVSIKQATAVANIKTFMGLDSAEITGDLLPGYSASDVKTYLDTHLPNLLNSAQTYHYNGTIKELIHSQNGTQKLFILALIFIYLILAAQFESFVDPLIILLTVPLCIVGALLTLSVFGQSLNIYSKIGLLTLVGLVTKHGILLVEFANVQRKLGQSPIQAAIISAQSRLRPILMTSLTMILGALPLALASGPGSLGRINIGLVLVGGLIAGTFFSLFVVPVAYVGMAKLKQFDVLASIRSKH